MTTKKGSTNRGAQGKARRSVEARARAIVADVKGYDSDTRKSIKYMLDTRDEDLAEFVERAEKGDTICDVTRIDAEQMKAARAVARLLALPGLPAWLAENIDHMLRVASADRRVDINRAPDDATLSPAKLADLFAVVPARDHYEFERVRDFAALLSAALAHPDCPGDIYNAVADCDSLHPSRWDTPEAIRFALGMPATADTPAPPRRVNDLAQMIADVWQHPDCPREIRDGLCGGNSELFNRLNEGGSVYATAEYNRALIAEHLRQQK